jgi:hypothetical protein
MKGISNIFIATFPTSESDTDEQGLTFEQTAAAKYQKIKEGKKKAIEKKEKNDDARLRKTPTSHIPSGLTSAIHEWVRALLGLPRQSVSPTSPRVDIHTVTRHHLPEEAKTTEVEAWSNHSKNRSEYLDSTITQKMAQRLAANPKASPAAKAELKKQISKEVIADYSKRTPPGKFVSRIAQTTASIQSYDKSRLAIAEASLASCGFPRLTLQWTSALSTAWNTAVIDTLVASWLECYNSRGVPACYDIPTSDDTPKLAKQILTKWMSNKRRQFRQELKDKQLISTPEGQQTYVNKKLEAKDKKAMQAIKKKVNDSFYHSRTNLD